MYCNCAPLIRASIAFVFTILKCCLEHVKVSYLVLEQEQSLVECLSKEVLNQGFKLEVLSSWLKQGSLFSMIEH